MLCLYKAQNTDLILLHKGLISEQFVGQQMVATNELEKSELYYWLREGRSNNAEVDFVIQKGLEIIPIEVKFGKSGSIKSLVQFVKERGSKRAIRFFSGEPKIEVKVYS